MIRELFRRKEPQALQIDLGPITVTLPDPSERSLSVLMNIADNLQFAETNGVKPLSLKGALAKIEPEQIGKIVLFDTPRSRWGLGNHWRIIGMNEEEQFATVQLCGPFGNNDYSRINPVTISLDTIMFTGYSLEFFELNGMPVNLGEVVKVIEEAGLKTPKSLKWLGEEIFFFDSEGEPQEVKRLL